MDTNKFDIKKAKDISARLSDVKGIDEIREEIDNLIRMVREPERYHSKGANLHKGVLLYGAPGTGKTLLARAIAGEAGCSFIYCTGSHFDEMFVGVGAKRIRELFNEAKKNKPCIIFIDEIDAVGRTRGGAQGNDERDQTLNQMLSEMDGFQNSSQVIVMAATNRQATAAVSAASSPRWATCQDNTLMSHLCTSLLGTWVR